MSVKCAWWRLRHDAGNMARNTELFRQLGDPPGDRPAGNGIRVGQLADRSRRVTADDSPRPRGARPRRFPARVDPRFGPDARVVSPVGLAQGIFECLDETRRRYLRNVAAPRGARDESGTPLGSAPATKPAELTRRPLIEDAPAPQRGAVQRWPDVRPDSTTDVGDPTVRRPAELAWQAGGNARRVRTGTLRDRSGTDRGRKMSTRNPVACPVLRLIQ